MLFALGACYEECNKRLSAPLEVSVSKARFIELALRSGITGKRPRSLYKNLEALEKQKLIVYDSRNLQLTSKGKNLFAKVQKEVKPYIDVNSILASKDILKFAKKAQTILKQ